MDEKLPQTFKKVLLRKSWIHAYTYIKLKYPIKGQQWPSQTTPANKYEAVCQELVACFGVVG